MEKDNRRYKRETVPSDIILLMDGMAKKFKIIDISPGGISFISPSVIANGEDVQLIYEDGKRDLIVLDGALEWESQTNSVSGYRIRCIFRPDLQSDVWKCLKESLLA